MNSDRKKIVTYTSDNCAVLNHITKNMKACLLLLLSHLFKTSWKEMITKQKIQYGISCMTSCFSLSEISLPYKGMFTQELLNRNSELTEGFQMYLKHYKSIKSTLCV